jgi:hypothetical protein
MRLVERIGDTEQIGRTGKWQTREYRDKSAQFRSAMSMVELGSKIDPIENPATSWDRFDSYDWLVSPEKRGWTVYDLVHAHRLVGISREKLHTLLGPGVNSKMQNVSSDPLALDTETYPLFWHYRGTDNDFFLEFSFAHEHVRAFRSIILASRN